MAPGFLLLLSVVLLAALSPVVFAVAVGCLFFDAARPYAARMVVFGVIGGFAGLALFMALSAFRSQVNASNAEHLAIFGAGFTIVALVGALVLFFSNRRRSVTRGV